MHEYYFDSDARNPQTVVWRKDLETGWFDCAIDPAYPDQAPGTSGQDAVWFRSVCQDSDFKPEEKYSQEEVPSWAI